MCACLAVPLERGLLRFSGGLVRLGMPFWALVIVLDCKGLRLYDRRSKQRTYCGC